MEKITHILLSVQDRHYDFFMEANTTIIDFVEVDWYALTVCYKDNPRLPEHIIADINNLLNQ